MTYNKIVLFCRDVRDTGYLANLNYRCESKCASVSELVLVARLCE